MTDASLAHLLARIAIVEARVRRAVAARQADDPQPRDPFRGLYVSDDAVLRLLSGTREPVRPDALEEARVEGAEREADHAAADGAEVRLRGLVEAFALTDLDVEVLLVALAPDLDTRFEWMYGYLNDDVTRRRATVGLALSLCGVPPAAADARAVFRADSALVGGGLVVIEDGDRPLLSRTLRVPDRVASHLLGDDRVDPVLTDVRLAQPPSGGRDDPRLAAAVTGAPRGWCTCASAQAAVARRRQCTPPGTPGGACCCWTSTPSVTGRARRASRFARRG